MCQLVNHHQVKFMVPKMTWWNRQCQKLAVFLRDGWAIRKRSQSNQHVAVPSDSSNLARDEIFWFCDRFWEAATSSPCWKVLCSTTTNKIRAVLRAAFLQNVQMWQWYSCYSDKTWMTIFSSISAAVAPVPKCPSQGWKLSLQGGSLLSTWPPKSSSWRWCSNFAGTLSVKFHLMLLSKTNLSHFL